MAKGIKIGRETKLWYVTSPNETSTLGDICFEATFRDLALQIKGGLPPEQIEGAYGDEDDAKGFAQKILEAAQAGQKLLDAARGE